MAKENEQKELNYSLKLIFKSSIIVSIAIFLSKILTYLYRVIIARYFGPEEYGLFSLGMMIFLWVFAISTLGLLDGALRFVSFYRGQNEKNKIKYVLKISSITLFISTIVSALALYLLSDFISISIFRNPDLISYIKIFSIVLPFYVFYYLCLSVIQAFEKITALSFILDFLENSLKLSILAILIFIGFKTNAIIFSYSLGIILVFVVSFLYCKYKLSDVFGKINLNNFSKEETRRKLFSYSWPLIFSSMLVGILPYIDSFVIGFFKNVSEVGIYNAAVPIAALMVFAPHLFSRLFLPFITKEFSRQKTDMIGELSKQTQKWIFIINLPIFLLIIIFPGDFINILFGSDYISGVWSLRFLTIGYFFVSMGIVLNNLLTMAGKSKLILINTIIISFLNFIIDIILVPIYGITGAAIATMSCYIILYLLLFFQVRHYTSIVSLRRKMLQILISIILPTLLLIYIKRFFTINIFTIALLSSFFIISYILMIFLTKSLDKNDIMVLRSIKNKFFSGNLKTIE